MKTFEQRAHEIIAILKAAAAKLSELDKRHAEAAIKARQLDKAA